MVTTTLSIANGSYVSDSLPVSAQQCVNMYPNIVQTEGLNKEVLFPTPGIRLLTTSGDDAKCANRGAFRLNGVPYFVNGEKLYRLESDLSTLTEVGDIPGTGRVSMAENGTQLCILVPGAVSRGFIFTTDPDSLIEITDANFKVNGQPQSVVYIDQYFVFTTDTKKFIVSNINNGLSYSALDFGTAESSTDPTISAIVFKNQLFIGGTETIEAFQNIGGAGFPFIRTGLFLSKGIKSQFSVVETNNTFMFLGAGKDESPAIWSYSKNDVERVSTTAIDAILSKLTDDELSQVFAWSYSQAGGYFVAFSLPDTTIVFDSASGRWHDRKSSKNDGFGGLVQIRNRINSLVSAYGKILVGDSQDGRIGCLERDVYTEYGFNIVRDVVSQPYQNNMDSFFIPRLELTVESGVGDLETEEPLIGLQISKDGGKTFRYNMFRRIGKIGEYDQRVIWRRLGRIPRMVVFRFSISDPIKIVIIQLTADIEGET